MSVKFCPVSGKQSYETRKDADLALKAIQAKPQRHRTGAGVYKCEHHHACADWHLTSHLNDRSKRRKADALRKVIA